MQLGDPSMLWSRSASATLYIENALELLDEPGEWYFDRPAKTVY